MSENIKHECGIAMVRLLKPLEYYQQKYGSAFWGLNKMYLLMEKQHNRGQDGAGIAAVKIDAPVGRAYIDRVRSKDPQSILEIFKKINSDINRLMASRPKAETPQQDLEWIRENIPFASDIYLGHVRYGTYGGNTIEAVHPFMRENITAAKTLVVAGNFNMTNVDFLYNRLVEMGHHPIAKLDTITVMERIGHFLDEEVDALFARYKSEGLHGVELAERVARQLDTHAVLVRAAKRFDGGFSIAGLVGQGDAFVLRDPAGIRPAFYYADEEVVVVASERPVIQTTFNVPIDSVHEIEPGSALIMHRDGRYELAPVMTLLPKKACSFERIYFSRGSDADIYRERKTLGRNLVEPVLKKIDYDIPNTVFSYIPNTAESSYFGLMEGFEEYLNERKAREISALIASGETPSEARIHDILSCRIRSEKIAIKDAKLRTFITEDASRDDMVAHVYDVTYGVVRPQDNLVLIDDSIVRGTTLRQSIVRIMDRLHPAHLIILSSAPQIRYPDCYGIDMARLGDFIAFRAAIDLLRENGLEEIIDQVYRKCKAQQGHDDTEMVNYVKDIYAPFTDTQISDKIAELITAPDIHARVSVIYQTVEGLHKACPNHLGDWYFTGDYPTAGGNRVVNQAFINFMEGRKERAY